MKIIFNELSHYQNKKNMCIKKYYFTTYIIFVFILKFFVIDSCSHSSIKPDPSKIYNTMIYCKP